MHITCRKGVLLTQKSLMLMILQEPLMYRLTPGFKVFLECLCLFGGKRNLVMLRNIMLRIREMENIE